MATSFNPLFSKREITSPMRPRWRQHGFRITRVLSILLIQLDTVGIEVERIAVDPAHDERLAEDQSECLRNLSRVDKEGDYRG